MKASVLAPPAIVAAPGNFVVRPGPALLSELSDAPHVASFTSHRERWGPPPAHSLSSLVALVEAAGVRGRGGAGFPFARKLSTAAAGRRRPVVVVNFSEGEPASAKDAALAAYRPQLVLDGARVVAQALGAPEVHVVVPGERPGTSAALYAAMAERPDHFIVHKTEGGFVGGQARAVLELMAGRANLPVTAWTPEAVRGHRGRPTLLSNAETFAQVGWLVLAGSATYASLGTPEEPGTTLMTLVSPAGTQVREVAYGDPLPLPEDWTDGPVLLGGFAGSWVPEAQLRHGGLRVSVAGLAAAGTPLGAGVLIAPGGCPVRHTATITSYLAAQSARRCGPCRRGLPELSDEVRALASGDPSAPAAMQELIALVSGRGACAHPDGVARLANSLVQHLPELVAAHLAGQCPECAERLESDR